jgi:predicted DNA-binding transcriptional regulator
MEEYKKAATLENEIESQLLDSILNERNIPHRITSYYDTAYDGLYQTQKGWGYISAPKAYLKEIQEIISSIREDSNRVDILS